MQNGEPADSGRRPWRIRLRRWVLHPCLVVLLGLVVTGLIVLLCIRGRNSAAEEAVEEKLAAIRARSEPVTPEDIAPPAVPDEENAALLFQAAFDAAQVAWQEQEGAGVEGWEELLEKEGEPDLTLAKRALDLYADARAKARLALARPRCRFDVDYPRGYDAPLPHLADLRALARLFALEALVASAEGRGDDAAESCLAALALGRLLETEPILISQLVRIPIVEWDGVRSAQHSLKRTTFSNDSLLRIRERLVEIDPVSLIGMGLTGDRVFLIRAYDDVLAGKMRLPRISAGLRGRLEVLSPRFLSFRIREDEAFALEGLGRVLAAVELPPCEAFSTVNAVFSEMGAEIHSGTSKHILTYLRFPEIDTAYTRTAMMWASRDAAVIGLSCELFRSAKGRYPKALDELAPEFLKEIPPDPFTGKPFRYELRDGGRAFIVYSVGENLKDDGGAGAGDHAEKDDISWEGRARGVAEPAAAPVSREVPEEIKEATP